MRGGRPVDPSFQRRLGIGLNSRRVWVLFACQALIAGGMALSFPFLAIYLHRQRGIPMSWVGGALAASVVVTSFSHGLGGELSDLIGRKRVLLLSMALRSLSVLAMAAAVWGEASFPALTAIHVLSNFVGNFFDPAARGWIADHCGPNERSRAYGLLRIAVNLGWAAGPALGGALAASSYPLMFALSALACAACAVLVALYLEDRPGARRQGDFNFGALWRVAEDRRFMRLCFFDVLIALVMAQLVVSMSVHATTFAGLSEAQVGILFSINGLIVVLLQYPVGRLCERWKISSALAAGSLLYAGGYGGVGFSKSMATLSGAIVVVTLGEIVMSPGLQALAANMAPHGLKGRYLGALGFSHQFGTALGPLIGGLGLEHLSPAWAPGPWVVLAAVAVLAAGGFASVARELSPAEEGLSSVPAAGVLSKEAV